jgi:hypothetical protein
MSYKDIIKVQARLVKGKRRRKRKNPVLVVAAIKRTRKTEVEVAKDEIEVIGLRIYCAVLQFEK